MACNREAPADGSTSSAPPACQNAEALVPCCNSNCVFFGCPATMNLCPRCYSEHILKEGSSVFLDQPSDTTVDPSMEGDPSLERFEAEPSLERFEVEPLSAMPAIDQPNLPGSTFKENSMNRSVGVSDLHSIFKSLHSLSENDMLFEFPEPQIPSPLSLPSRSTPALSPVQQQAEKESSSMPPLSPSPQAVSRCLACRKRVGLRGFKCRCGDTFCSLHRYSDKHNCSFDYKAAGRVAIAKENPVVKPSKIDRI